VPLTFDVIAAAGGPGKLDAAAAPASSMVTPGILGFLVFAALAVALVFLIKSMNKQFRKITPDPGSAPGAAASAADDPAKQETPK
jgi:hypothetical protein